MFKFFNKDFQVMKEDKQYYEACLKRIDNNLKHFYVMMQNIQEWHQTMDVRMSEMEFKLDKLERDQTKILAHLDILFGILTDHSIAKMYEPEDINPPTLYTSGATMDANQLGIKPNKVIKENALHKVVNAMNPEPLSLKERILGMNKMEFLKLSKLPKSFYNTFDELDLINTVEDLLNCDSWNFKFTIGFKEKSMQKLNAFVYQFDPYEAWWDKQAYKDPGFDWKALADKLGIKE